VRDSAVKDNDTVDLHVAVEGKSLRVTMPGTHYAVTFRICEDPAFWSHFDLSDAGAPITPSVFLQRAWDAARERARELGWMD